MKNGIVDLHVHSTCSDGTYTPEELVDCALKKGLRAFALTDHDTTEGLDRAIRYAEGRDIEVVPGIEFSTEYESRDIHILGLYIDYEKKEFKEQVQAFIDSRTERNRKMCANLQKAGVFVTYEDLLSSFPGSTITRAHYARYLLEHGYVKSIAEAFDRYVGDHCPCYVPREKVTPAQAIDLILRADGIPILAHPLLYRMGRGRLEKLVASLKEAGLIGLEAVYSTNTPSEEREMRRLAERYHLLISGGSDFHGANKPKLDLAVGYGTLFIPAGILEDLKKSRIRLVFSDLDGTLLNRESHVSAKTGKAVASMLQKGHRLILTSGRPLNSILEVMEDASLRYPGMLVIANNGSLIYDCDKKGALAEFRLSAADLRYLIKEADKMGIYCHAYSDTHIIAKKQADELAFYTQKIHLPVTFTEDIAAALPEGSFKLMTIHLTDKTKLEAFREQIAEYCKGRIQIVFSSDYYMEILPIQAGKGNAVRFVCEYFHVPLNRSYACGDAENDISMLQAAGIGIAMKNGDEPVKQAADFVTQEDNDHDGLIPLFEKLAEL